MNHVAVDVGEASLEAVVIKGQPLVVEAKKVQDCGVQIVDGGDVLLSLPAKQIRCTVCVTALDASAGKPSGEAVGIVVGGRWPLFEKWACGQTQCTRRPAYPRAGRAVSGRATGPQRVGLAQGRVWHIARAKPCDHPSY